MRRGFEAMEENLHATLGIFALAKPEGETHRAPGVALVCSRVRYSMFNTAMLTSPVESAAEFSHRLDLASSFFRQRGLPWSFWLCTAWLNPDAGHPEPACAEHGLDLITDLPGMASGPLPPARRALPPLDYRRVRDAETRASFTHIMAASFGVPYAIAREIYDSERTWSGPLEGYVGYGPDGNALATTAVTIHAGVIGIYAVGTLPSEQRHGYGEAMMRCVVSQAERQSGVKASVLQSSPAGYRLYDRLGYSTIARYLVFARV